MGGASEITGLRPWVVAGVAALLGWLLAVLLVVAGVRPLGWVLLSTATVTVGLATLLGRARGFKPFEVLGFTFACILLEWPPLVLVSLAILGWNHVARWG
ncbi:MAG: hypothetical protein ACYDA6_10770 [Solirubrobacteraceae bacterium]